MIASRAGYRAMSTYMASAPRCGARAQFEQAGQTFGLAQQGTIADVVVELRKASDPFGGATVSDNDPEPFQRAYVTRLQRVAAEAERLPHERSDVQQLLWALGADIRSYKIGGGR
jgi:hypothetical protein